MTLELMRKYLFSFASCFVGMALAPLVVLATSFDCSQLLTNVESLICSSGELSKLDDVLAEAYRVAKSRARTSTQLAREQRQWLAQRDACTDRECIKATYELRIRELKDSPGTRSAVATPGLRGFEALQGTWRWIANDCRPDACRTDAFTIRRNQLYWDTCKDVLIRFVQEGETGTYLTELASPTSCARLKDVKYLLFDVNTHGVMFSGYESLPAFESKQSKFQTHRYAVEDK